MIGPLNKVQARGKDQHNGELPEAAVAVEARMAGSDRRREQVKRKTKAAVAFGDANEYAGYDVIFVLCWV